MHHGAPLTRVRGLTPWWCFVAFAGCDDPVAPQAASARAPVPSTSVTTTATLPPPDAPLDLPDGCYSGIDPGDPAETLRRIQEACVPGMVALLEPKPMDLRAGSEVKLEISVGDPARCLRAIVVAETKARDLDVALLDPRGSELASDDLRAPFALVTPRGPVCVDGPGTHQLSVRAERDAKAIAGIWRAR